ncbi:bacitracin synthase 2-like [Anneissia japonica]|uniref:bacitracin synthase 2-like n=1 Tax=Anneissia japonica TaxID=1529436 RepID=UPI0014255834|nr:bacitracin synthase 2-like [Anneissia japonica]
MSTLCHKRFPLSSYQQRMVILQQTSPKSTAYVETVFCRLSKNIEPTDAIKALAVKHPMLTSKIEMSNDNKMYTMNVTGQTLFDIESETLNEKDNLNDYVIESTPIIDVISSPLYKFRHLFTATNRSFFVLHVHHVIVDVVTLQALAKDLQAIATGTLPQSEPHAYHYSEYVENEEMYMTTVQHESDKTFWTKAFSSLPPDATLATQSKSEYRQTSAAIYRAREEVWDLPKEMMKEITKYCKALGVTHFQYFLSCTSLVLQRYLGVDDFIIAIPVTTRSDMSMKADGLFINTVLFRVAVNKNQTLQEFVKYISVEWWKALCHSRYPIEQVTKSLWKENGRCLDTLCSVMFNFTTHCQTDEIFRIGSKHAKMPLSLDIIYNEKTDSCRLISEWADGLIDSDTAKRLSNAVAMFSSEGFQTTEMLFEREILSPSELQLLLSFNADPDHSEKYHLPVHKEFEKYAARDATATAVFFNENNTSYGQLNSISTRIAHFLSKSLSEQVLQQNPVVIVMEKDQNAIASILAIWKAGGHFLPVALSNETCLKDIFECETPAALLYNVETPTIKFVSTSCPVWSVEDILKFSQDAQVVWKSNESRSTGGDIAYVIRTSGSTGKPKRCQISHKSLWIIAEAWKQKYSMSKSVINVLQWAPLSFDVFIGDVVRALVCVQGKLIICPDNRRLDIPYIRNLIKKQHVTLFETTPQFGLQIINNSDAKDLESIKVFILGSDVLHGHVYKQIRCRLRSDQRLINSYGMTEATIDSSFFEGDEVPITRSGTVPIGKPLPGVMMYILDSKTLQPCPVGTIGELYISGDILATGDVKMVQINYFQRQALKTGDSARWLPTGDIELIGRLDDIVKLRGFRISTTEIENKIVGLIDGVKEAHVTVISNYEKSEIEFLCAFLVIEEGFQQRNTVTHQRVTSKLRSQIPYYMLPDKIQIIREVPLTSHGKVNRKALPKIVHTPTPICHTQQIDANTATITKLKEWFAEALDLKHHDLVSNSRTFTEQGGHSLILVRFWSLITSNSNFKIEIADLFSYPTISSLAEFIKSQEKVGGLHMMR